MSDCLNVMYRDWRVGSISQNKKGEMSFQYDESWLEHPSRFPISLRIPLRPNAFDTGISSTFFSNLLPEGTLRQMVTRRLGISEDNDFSLLEAIGGECAGALRIVAEIFTEEASVGEQRPLSTEELSSLIRNENALPFAIGDKALRLSLAGAQDKLPVRYEDDKLYLPEGGRASTHILKFPNRRFKHLPANEVFVMQLAKAVGLNVAGVQLLTKHAAMPLCLVDRYDRQVDAEGEVERLHQEDFCQALGYRSSHKYQGEGGPDLARCFSLLLDVSDEPLLDTRALLDWHVFNCIAGNADGHGKNLSMMLFNGIRLSPFYDLVCTHVYPVLDKKMAMRTGDQANPFQIGRGDWQQLSDAVGMGEGYFLNRISTLSQQVLEVLPAHVAQFEIAYEKQTAVQLIVPGIKKRIRALMNGIQSH